MKNQFRLTVCPLFLAALVLGIFAVMDARALTAPASNPGVLDAHRRFALGMIETGNDDLEIGGLGEVSRYQIMPSVWRHYSNSHRYHDPET